MKESGDILIIGLQKGDRIVMKLLFDKYYQALCAFANRFVLSTSIAEDMAQESFLALWEQHKSFESIQAVKAYLYTSVRNKCLNYLKHDKVVRSHIEASNHDLNSEQFFNQSIVEEDLYSRLYQEVMALPDSCRKVMLLALDGLKNSEIAEKLDISINTVKTQKTIALKKLRVNLSDLLPVLLLFF